MGAFHYCASWQMNLIGTAFVLVIMLVIYVVNRSK